MKRTRIQATGFLVFAATLALFAGQAWAQNPTGTLTGRVSDDGGGALPGVTVSAESPALQGSRTTMTNENGSYKLAFLPPGVYQVTYGLEGFNTSVREVKISAAQTTPSNIILQLGTVTEEIVVTSQQSVISETGTGATTITYGEIESLPLPRELDDIINLTPGVANSGFRDSTPVMAGAPSYENLYLVNGVVINENVRAQILNLFIEDAVDETTTSISGISAEYGRFTGGVVNAITKSGGNRFEGSFRINLSNESWESKTPLTGDQTDNVNEIYEATLGGYFIKDHLWFFAAGRDRATADTASTDITLIDYPRTDEEARTEIKLTVSPNDSHSIIGSYLDIERDRTNTDFGTILDQRSLNPNRGDPQEITSVNYTGILSQSFFIEGQWSERLYTIGAGSGGPQDLIDGTLIRTRGESFRYWAPTFCGPCDNEERNNENLLAKGSYFLSSESLGFTARLRPSRMGSATTIRWRPAAHSELGSSSWDPGRTDLPTSGRVELRWSRTAPSTCPIMPSFASRPSLPETSGIGSRSEGFRPTANGRAWRSRRTCRGSSATDRWPRSPTGPSARSRSRPEVGTRRSFSMPSWIAGSIYPDTDVPDAVKTLDERVDFLARLCAAWDFGVLPEAETVAEIRRPEWRPAVDACRLLTSPAYHLVREWHDLPELPYLGQEMPYIRDDPNLAYI